MKPEDFPQFDDPRVREVMAAAANLVEAIDAIPEDRCIEHELWVWKNEELRTALFAAQHSAPHKKTRTVRVEPPCGPCLLVDDVDAAQHSKPKLENCSECGAHPAMLGKCQNSWCKHRPAPQCLDCQEAAQHSKPKKCEQCGHTPCLGPKCQYPRPHFSLTEGPKRAPCGHDACVTDCGEGR